MPDRRVCYLRIRNHFLGDAFIFLGIKISFVENIYNLSHKCNLYGTNGFAYAVIFFKIRLHLTLQTIFKASFDDEQFDQYRKLDGLELCSAIPQMSYVSTYKYNIRLGFSGNLV